MASSSNPNSTPSTKLPDQVEKAIAKKEKEIEELTKEWEKVLEKKCVHLRRIAEEEREIRKMKGDIRAREARVRREHESIKDILEEFKNLQAKITNNYTWIEETKSIFKIYDNPQLIYLQSVPELWYTMARRIRALASILDGTEEYLTQISGLYEWFDNCNWGSYGIFDSDLRMKPLQFIIQLKKCGFAWRVNQLLSRRYYNEELVGWYR